MAPIATLLDDYQPPRGAFDEMVGADGSIRRHWDALIGSLSSMGSEELAHRRRETDRLLADDGVTYHRFSDAGSDGLAEVATIDRAERRRAGDDTRWLLDPVPVIMASEDWREIENGLIQRAELLDMVLSDLYGPRDLLRRRVIPPELVLSDPGYLRPCHGVRLPGAHQLFTLAVDLARGGDGTLYALADRAQAPSGAGYALENRIVVSRVFPSLYRDAQAHRLAPFFRALRSSLLDVAPPSARDPRIVVLSPGPQSETAFEHAFVASYLGYSLVQGSDLVVQDGRVWLRTLGRLEPVDVILRRVDALYSDPLELRPDSELGVPGLVEACRLGRVSVVNPLGAGVLENPALAAFLPRVSRELLGQELRLPSVPTWWCGEEAGRRHVLDNLETMVIKPVKRVVGPGALLGSSLTARERDDLRRSIDAHPSAYVGQAELGLGSVPALVDRGLAPRRMVLRSFLVCRNGSYVAMAGGLARVATDAQMARIANQAGAWSKDVWVLTSEPETGQGFWLGEGPVAAVDPEASMSARAGENLFWLARYAERAEDAVRLLRAVHDRRNEFGEPQRSTARQEPDSPFPRAGNPAGTACLTALYQSLTHVTATYPGFFGADVEHPTAELASVLFDGGRTGTVAFSVARLMDAARAVRDQLSSDTWGVLAALERELFSGTGTGADRTAMIVPILNGVLQPLLALAGLEAESLVRDPGWRFLQAGRRLERAIHMSALLRATLGIERDRATDSLLLESVLTAAESIITYRRRYRSRARLATVLDLLLLDEANPRSIAYQLVRLTESVAAFPGRAASSLTDVDRLVLETSTLVRLADTTALSAVAPDGTRPDLVAFLTRLSDQLWRIGDVIAAAHFSHQPSQRALQA